MGQMYFPGEKMQLEKLINRYDGSLTERYKDDKGRTVEDHHKAGEKSPLISRDIFSDKANHETIYFKGEAGKEKPYLRRIFDEAERVKLEQGLNGSLDKLCYEEEYIYNDNRNMPSTTIRKEFDENGKSLSNMLEKASNKGHTTQLRGQMKDFDRR